MSAAPDTRPVALLYTGGTFGMVRSQRGYVPSDDLPARVDSDVPGLREPGMPPVRWLDPGTGPPVNSADIDPPFWFRLARTMRAHAPDHAGFVVIHGTDTLAYTGAALAFLLAGIDRPVIVTGARAPLGETGSDAGDNLCRSVRVAADPGAIGEVGLLFGPRLLRANRATKRHGDPERPFTSPLCEPLARVDDAIEWRAGAAAERPNGDPPAARLDGASARVALLAMYPGVDATTVRALAGTRPQAMLLDAYPAAIGPGGDTEFVAALAEAAAAGIVLGAVSQARSGCVRFGRYAAGTPLAEAGVVGGVDMTREAALAKLHYLFATDPDPGGVRARFARDLCGELTPE